MTTCIDRLNPNPPPPQEPPVLCSATHCNEYEQTSTYRATCYCRDWLNNPIANCNVKDASFPVQTASCFNHETSEWANVTSLDCSKKGWPWYWRTCYCCCSCFRSDTPVAAPGGARPLGDFVEGDEVLAASHAGGGAWAWAPLIVEFSSGSPPVTDPSPTAGNLMIYVEYGERLSLIASPNQLFTLTNGKLKRADQLVPGSDELAGADGGALALGRVATGQYKGGVHHIATTVVTYEKFDGKIDGHLINANGVVVGDFLLQMFQDTEKLAPYIDRSAPSIGTSEYAEMHPDLFVKPYVVGPSHEVVGMEITASDFVPYGESTTDVPDDATALFTRRQEAMLLDPDIPKRGFSDPTNYEEIAYLVKLFAGFHPEVDIVLDWESTHPNVFGYTEDGVATVVVGGELLRLAALYREAVTIAVACGIAAATTDQGLPGRALFDGASTILLDVLRGFWTQTVHAGQAQLQTVLAALEKKEPAGMGTRDAPSASCLIEVLDAAVSGKEVPECATGRLLSVEDARYEGGTLVVAFSAAIDPSTASVSRNYHLSPSGTVSAVSRDPADPASVRIEVELPPGAYVLDVARVRAKDGTPLNPARSSARFEVPV